MAAEAREGGVTLTPEVIMDEPWWPAIRKFLTSDDEAIGIVHPCVCVVARSDDGYLLDWCDGDPSATDTKVFSTMRFVDDELELRTTLLTLAYPGSNQ